MDLPSIGNLRLSVMVILTPFCATHVSIFSSDVISLNFTINHFKATEYSTTNINILKFRWII